MGQSLVIDIIPSRIASTRLVVFVAILLLQPFVLLLPCLSSADEIANVRAQLQKEKLAVEQEQLVLNALEDRKNELLGKQEALKRELEKLELRQLEIQKEAVGLQSEQVVLGQTIHDLDDEHDMRVSRFDKRIVAMYKLAHRAASLHYLIQSESANDLLRRVHDLRYMIRYDREGLLRLKNVITRLSKTRDEISLLEKTKNSLRQELEELKGSLVSKKEQQDKIIAEVIAHKAKQETIVSNLTKSTKSLQKSLAQIMGSVRRKKADSKVETLRGLSSLKGRLPYPVTGRILQGYGKQKHKEFSDVLLIKGVEFRVDSGRSVKAIASGKVIFSDSLPGYGTMIIVDHGQRFYTLYGKLANPKVSVGKVVEAGEDIASISDATTDSAQGNFYFELRHKGIAVNPEPFFSKTASF